MCFVPGTVTWQQQCPGELELHWAGGQLISRESPLADHSCQTVHCKYNNKAQQIKKDRCWSGKLFREKNSSPHTAIVNHETANQRHVLFAAFKHWTREHCRTKLVIIMYGRLLLSHLEHASHAFYMVAIDTSARCTDSLFTTVSARSASSAKNTLDKWHAQICLLWTGQDANVHTLTFALANLTCVSMFW